MDAHLTLGSFGHIISLELSVAITKRIKIKKKNSRLWHLVAVLLGQCVSCSVVSDSLRPHGLASPTRLLHPWDFPGKSTGVGCHFLLQRIFLPQGRNLLYYWQILYHLLDKLLANWKQLCFGVLQVTVALWLQFAHGPCGSCVTWSWIIVIWPSTTLVTHSQLWPENTKWKIPEKKKKFVSFQSHAVLGSMMKSHAILYHLVMSLPECEPSLCPRYLTRQTLSRHVGYQIYCW